jgi:hypothetical protein
MAQRMMWKVALVGLLALTFGCTVYVQESPPPRRVVVVEQPPPPPPPPPATTIVITQDDEVHYVVYREYFGCSEQEIYILPHYRRYYALTDDDIYFIYFVARRRGIAFDVCFHSYYYDCGRSYDRLVVTYNVPRTAFFCQVNVGVTSYPPVYQRTYVAYQQNNVTNITIQNNEYVALVHMKVGVEYQGHAPNQYFAQVNANGGNTGRVIVANKESCGHGGITATGAKVGPPAPHPWTMTATQKQTWHEEHKAAIVKHEDQFKTAHKEQVQKVQTQKTPAGQKSGEPGKAHSEHPEGQKPQGEASRSGQPGGQPPAQREGQPGSPGVQGQPPHEKPGAPGGAAAGEKHKEGEPKQGEASGKPPSKEKEHPQGEKPKSGKPEEDKGKGKESKEKEK